MDTKETKAPTNEERIKALEGTVAKQNQTIKALSDQLQKATAPAKEEKPQKAVLPDKTFKVDDREFEFVLAEFVFGEARMTAVDALADKTVLAELVKRGSGVIKEVH